MQDIGGGRLFVGGNGGDRRLRQQVNVPQALKCPRCESLNTKFCYYNNYNLSQPRHFCKSCRRYWTKGGVLRNVPVGGGCRKAKRTKKSNSVRKPTNGNSNNNNNNPNERKLSNSQNSSSDSSSLTANTTTVNTTMSVDGSLTAITETGSGSGSTMVNIQETPTTSYFNHGFDPTQQLDIGNSLFTDIGHNWVADDVLPFRLHHTSQDQPWMGTDELKVTGSAGHGQLGFVGDQSNELKTSDVVLGTGLGTEDWNNGTDEALFDLTGTVDQSYWSQTHWDGHDHDNNNQLNYLP